jgi:hypothetical protein
MTYTFIVEEEKMVEERMRDEKGKFVKDDKGLCVKISVVKVIRHYVGILSPLMKDYEILRHSKISEAILHTDKELPLVKDILDRNNIKYKMSPINRLGNNIALTSIRPYKKKKR